MTKSIYGQGSIYRRSVDGRWYGALDIGGGTGRRRRVTVSGANREAVEVRLARLHRRQRSAADEMTLADWLCRWRDELLPGTVAAESRSTTTPGQSTTTSSQGSARSSSSTSPPPTWPCSCT